MINISDLGHLEVVFENLESKQIKGGVGPFLQRITNIGNQRALAIGGGLNSNTAAINFLTQNGFIVGVNG